MGLRPLGAPRKLTLMCLGTGACMGRSRVPFVLPFSALGVLCGVTERDPHPEGVLGECSLSMLQGR